MENKNQIVNIAFILDDNFVIPTIAAITSLFINKKQDVVYNIYLITNCLSDENELLFENLKKENFNIEIKRIQEKFDDFKILTKGFHVSTSAILKFMLPTLLNSLDKVLYLDGDVIVQKDLLNLYNTDLQNKYAAVVEDLRPTFRYIETQLEKLQITHHRGYFNSGMMLLNLKQLRMDDITTKLFEYRKNGYNSFMDQDTFNVVFNDNVIFLSLLNNFLITLEKDFNIDELNNYYHLNKKYSSIDELIKSSSILHFSSKYKPWLYINTPYEKIWNEYFSKTSLNVNKLDKIAMDKDLDKKEKDIIISLTSYPARIGTVNKTIKSLLNQTIRAEKIILALGEDKFPRKELDLPQSLLSLRSNKFEILWVTKDLRSYTKLIPVLKKYSDKTIVTADDDIIYREKWLEKLYSAYEKKPKYIHCHRAHRITFDEKKQIKNYNDWCWQISNVLPSYNNFLTGVGGVLYPPKSLHKDVFREELFKELAPLADDIWFWAMAVLNKVKINVIENNDSNLSFIDGTQECCLCITNVHCNKNDEQLKKVLQFYPILLKRLDKKNKIYECEYSFIEKLFSIKNRESRDNKWYKVITILGIKLKFKNKELTQRRQLQALEQRVYQVGYTQELQFELIKNLNLNVKNISTVVEQLDANRMVSINGLEDELTKVSFGNVNKLQELEKFLLKLQESQPEKLDKLNRKLDKFAKKQDDFLTKFDLKSNFEIERCKEFAHQLEGIELTNKYKKLIKNLDKDSVQCVSSLLAKIKRIATSDSKSFDIFTDEEIKQISKLRKEYYPNILQLADGCYAYKQYLLPVKHFEASVFYYKHNIDALKDLDKIKNKSIIDVGAYIGDSAIVFEPYTNEKIYAFEPTKESYRHMLKTIELNESTKIVPINIALGSKEEDLEIYLQDSGSSINRIITQNPEKEKIQVTTLDKFVKENNIKVGLIKVDIEGFEQEFLKGAYDTIKTQKPTLLVSIYHNASDFFNIKPIIESWDLGYKFKIIKSIDGGIRGEILLVAEC